MIPLLGVPLLGIASFGLGGTSLTLYAVGGLSKMNFLKLLSLVPRTRIEDILSRKEVIGLADLIEYFLREEKNRRIRKEIIERLEMELERAKKMGYYKLAEEIRRALVRIYGR